MKRTISASLNGKAYTFDEDAYQALERYLNQLNRHFTNDPNKTEVIADIESRIAEHFDSYLKVPEQVINLDEVNRVINIMGLPKDFEPSAGADESTTGTYSKLYRDIDNRILGGVCSGMGHYWKADPVLFRLLFFLLALWGGLGVLIYLVLWVVTPPAVTPLQKNEMKGDKW